MKLFLIYFAVLIFRYFCFEVLIRFGYRGERRSVKKIY